MATCGKKLYSCTSTFSALNYCSGIFFKSASYLYEVVRTIFSADFWTFEIFERNFAKLMARRHLAIIIRNCLVHLKGQSILKKNL